MHLLAGIDNSIKVTASYKIVSGRWSDVRRYFSEAEKVTALIQ